jgi:hypothetical protein
MHAVRCRAIPFRSIRHAWLMHKLRACYEQRTGAAELTWRCICPASKSMLCYTFMKVWHMAIACRLPIVLHQGDRLRCVLRHTDSDARRVE